VIVRPVAWPWAIALAAAIGAAHTLAMLPLATILGTGPFWIFPRGIVAGGLVDMGQELMGYRYLAQAGWQWPLLHVPNITPPAGMNAFWLDPVPWLALLARLLAPLAGGPPNLLGLFLFAAFVLPGVAMTALLRAAGQRSLLAAAAAALLADPVPSLLIEWGHIALCAQGLTVLALALYVAGRRTRPHPWLWLALLATTLLTHLYLFVMVGGIWAASIAQAALDDRAARRRLAIQALLTIAATVALGVATGILSRDTASGGTTGFGVFSLNLASPFLPQLSGAFPRLAGYWVGMRSQVLGWPGIGMWMVVAAVVLAGARPPIRRHAALAAVLLAFALFALSDRVTLGARVLLEVPLPDKLAYALGAFRASGRFVWPVTYAALAWGLPTLLRHQRQSLSFAVLAVAVVLQVVDAGPLRTAVAASATHPLAPIFDRARAAGIIGGVRELAVFPSSGCIATLAPSPPQEAWLNQANVELQLLASEHNLPLNSVVNSRLATDCAAEARDRQAPLRPGVAYFYLAGPPPPTNGAVCAVLDGLLACRLP
jgi:hypothetical protein